jgi:hypothetical protein
VSKMEKRSGVEKLPDAEKLPDGEELHAKLVSFGSRRRTRDPSASVCRIVWLNANRGGLRCLSARAGARETQALRRVVLSC